MIKSMDTAVSAIKAQQTKLDVTANNIANVNTVGFKKSRTVFGTLLSSSMRTASAPANGRGGINPSQIGMGVQVSSIDTIHSQGVLAATSRGLDLAMQGEGFFVVSDGVKNYYTRNGAINLSPLDGSLALSNGMKLMGYPMGPDGKVDKSQGLGPISIPTGSDVIVNPTSNVEFAGNIKSSSEVGEKLVIPFQSYDSLGTKHEFNMEIEVTDTGEAKWTVTNSDGIEVTENTGTLEFDTNGKIKKVTGGPIAMSPVGADPMSIKLDFSKITMVDKASDFSMKSQDGMPAGSVHSVTVTNGGNVTITYSNGMSKDIAALGVAVFDNANGLSQVEGSLFDATQNSGEAMIVAGGESSKAAVVAGHLEGSNVDVSEELTEMIKTQRAYQMATKVITTSDEILQELANIKR